MLTSSKEKDKKNVRKIIEEEEKYEPQGSK